MSTAEGTIPPPAPPRAPRRYVRRDRGKWLAGVATGMADAFGIDVTVVRVLWVIVTLASFGVGVAAYALFWFAFPSEEHAAPISRFGHMREWSSGYVIGLVLLGIGALIVCGQLFTMRPYRHFGAFAWATLLIGAGAAVLLLRNPDERDDTPPPPPPPPPPGASAPPADVDPTDAVFVSDTSDATETTETTETIPPPPTFPRPPGSPLPPQPPTTSAWTQHAPWPAPPPRLPRLPRPRRRPFLTPLTLSALLIGGGIVALLNEANVTDITTADALAGAVLLIGLVLILSSRFGRARGLIPLGILLLLATIPATVIDVPITNGMGQRNYAPRTVEQVRGTYELGIGHLAIDLQEVPFAGQNLHVGAQLGIGQLEIDVPSTVQVTVHAHAGAGTITLFGGTYDNTWPVNANYTTPEPGTTGVLDIDARVGAGDITVHRYTPGGVETILQERYP